MIQTIGEKTKNSLKEERNKLILRYYNLTNQITIKIQNIRNQYKINETNSKRLKNITNGKELTNRTIKSVNLNQIQNVITYYENIIKILDKMIEKYNKTQNTSLTQNQLTNQSQNNTKKIATSTPNQQSKNEFARIRQQINRLEKMLQQFDDILYGRTPQTTSTGV